MNVREIAANYNFKSTMYTEKDASYAEHSILLLVREYRFVLPSAEQKNNNHYQDGHPAENNEKCTQSTKIHFNEKKKKMLVALRERKHSNGEGGW